MATNSVETKTPYGYCHCGCGRKTSVATVSDVRRRHVKGEPLRFVQGHGRWTLSLAQRFWEKVDKYTGPVNQELGTRCWLWAGRLNPDGYGLLWCDGKDKRVTHIAWFLEHGEWPKNNMCHRCDNPSCVRGSHLFDGTKAQNNADARNKGRMVWGENHPNAKLTTAQVLEIRSDRSGATQAKLARSHGVSQSSIYRILKNETWKHLEGTV